LSSSEDVAAVDFAVVAALLVPGTAWVNGQRVEASGGMFV
jgi:hypothetical protein